MTKIVEYRDVNDTNRSTYVELDERTSAQLQGRIVHLVHGTAGYEPAGSMARWTEEFFAVWFDMNGARCGQRYRDEASARAHFARLTD